MTIRQIRDQIAALESKYAALDQAHTELLAEHLALKSRVDRGPWTHQAIFSKEPPPVEDPKPLSTPSGVEEGDTCYAVYTGSVDESDPNGVHEATVVAVNSRRNRVTLVWAHDGTQTNVGSDRVFRRNATGLAKAQAAFDEWRDDRLESAARKAHWRLAVLTDARMATVEGTAKLSHKDLVSLASAAGLSPFHQLKGVTGDARLLAIAAGVRLVQDGFDRKTVEKGEEVMRLAAVVRSWEERQEELRAAEKARQDVFRKMARDARIAEEGTIVSD